MPRRLILLVIAGLLLLQPTSVSAMPSRAAVERCLSDWIRRENPRVRRTEHLSRQARRHTVRMARQETIWHSRPPRTRYAWGENVGMGPDCRTLHEAFMSSPGHRRNIRDRDWRRFGVGATIRGDTIYVAEHFHARSA
jgi:uncharacterized protein YkwD